MEVDEVKNVEEVDGAEVVNEKVMETDSFESRLKHRHTNPFKLYILDMYILKKFLGTFFLSTMLLLGGDSHV